MLEPSEVREILSNVVIDPADRRSTEEIAQAIVDRGCPGLQDEVVVEPVGTPGLTNRIDRRIHDKSERRPYFA